MLHHNQAWKTQYSKTKQCNNRQQAWQELPPWVGGGKGSSIQKTKWIPNGYQMDTKWIPKKYNKNNKFS